jgi:hypothetical protein
MATYIVRLYDINGRAAVTEDDEESAKEWLWRTLKRYTSDGAAPPYGHRPEIEFMKIEDSR